MGISKAERYLKKINYYQIRAKKLRRETDLEKYYTLKLLLDEEPKLITEIIEEVGKAMGKELNPKDKTTYMRFYYFIKRLQKDGLIQMRKEGNEYLVTAHDKVKEDLQRSYGTDKIFIMTIKDKEELQEIIYQELKKELDKAIKELNKEINALKERIDKGFNDLAKAIMVLDKQQKELKNKNKELSKELNEIQDKLQKLNDEVYNIKVLYGGALREIAKFLTDEIGIRNLKMEAKKKPFTYHILHDHYLKAQTLEEEEINPKEAEKAIKGAIELYKSKRGITPKEFKKKLSKSNYPKK